MESSLLENILSLPLGKKLGDDNWESFVYEIGDFWVYKEIKTEHDIKPETPNYENRYILQRFWCSNTHFNNVIHDQKIMQEHLFEWLPKIYTTRRQSRFNDNPGAIVSLQEKILGQTLSDTSELPSEYFALAKKVAHLAQHVFRAPLDFHAGNLIQQSETDSLFFIDTGTPSDWEYFLDHTKLQTAIEIGTSQARTFVTFMEPLHELHTTKCLLNKNQS